MLVCFHISPSFILSSPGTSGILSVFLYMFYIDYFLLISVANPFFQKYTALNSQGIAIQEAVCCCIASKLIV